MSFPSRANQTLSFQAISQSATPWLIALAFVAFTTTTSHGQVYSSGSYPQVVQGQTYSGGQTAGSRTIPSNWLSQVLPTDQRVHDFGTVARAAKTEHKFVFRNPLDQPIHLRSIRASCGCTTPTIVTEWIQPGEEGIVHARFNTGSFTGQKQATLTLTIDKPYYTEMQLTVRGYIRSDVVVNPGEIDFGSVREGESKLVEATIDYAGRGDWKIESVDCQLPYVSANVEEVTRGGGRVQYKVSVELAGNAPIGAIKNQIILNTNDRRLRTVPVALNLEVQSEIQISPNVFALGKVTRDKAVTQRLVIKGVKPFKILDVTSDRADIVFTATEDAKPAHLLNIEILPTSEAGGEVKGSLMVKTDLKDAPLKLPLSYTLDASTLPTATAAK